MDLYDCMEGVLIIYVVLTLYKEGFNLMWKKKDYKLYFQNTRDMESQAKASILKQNNFPKILFKYMKAKHAISSLKDDFIKFSDPFHVNDPFEGDMLFDYDLVSQQYKVDLLIQQLNVPDFNLSDEDKKRLSIAKIPWIH